MFTIHRKSKEISLHANLNEKHNWEYNMNFIIVVGFTICIIMYFISIDQMVRTRRSKATTVVQQYSDDVINDYNEQAKTRQDISVNLKKSETEIVIPVQHEDNHKRKIIILPKD
jgi:hypothetical protein